MDLEEVYEDRGVTVIVLGRNYHAVDGEAKDRVEQVLTRHTADDAPARLVLDLSRTVSVDSSFIGLLFAAEKRLRARGGRMAVCGADAFCADVLRIVKLGEIFPSYPSRDEAIEAMPARNQETEA
jgi:anti-anti-sigma factor